MRDGHRHASRLCKCWEWSGILVSPPEHFLPVVYPPVGTRYHRRHLLLLTTTGAKSGRPRTVPLLYFADGADLVVIGSKGGHPRHPAWYHNVRAHPQVTVYARGTRGEYQAREAHGAERARLREIPVVVLSAG